MSRKITFQAYFVFTSTSPYRGVEGVNYLGNNNQPTQSQISTASYQCPNL